MVAVIKLKINGFCKAREISCQKSLPKKLLNELDKDSIEKGRGKEKEVVPATSSEIL